MKNFKRILKLSALTVLIAVMVLSVFSCAKKPQETDVKDGEYTTITVEVVNSEGTHTDHVLKTNGATLADALKESGITEGDETEYGYYITTVDGELADYSVDSSYWCIMQDGEELMTGASSTTIADGDHYELVYTVYSFDDIVMDETALGDIVLDESVVADGFKVIYIEVVNSQGEHNEYTFLSDAETLADVLKESGITEGDETEYGYFITTVDGELADYSVDSSYWCIMQDGEELMTGASSTPVANGDHFELVYTIYG